LTVATVRYATRAFGATLLGAFMFVGAPAAAQTLTVGITAGLDISRFTGDGVNEVESRNTPFVTASIARHPWASRFGVEANVGYVMKGSTWVDAVRNTLRLNYIEAQALLRVAIPVEGADLRPVFFAGPAAGYLVTCEMHGTYAGAALTRPCDDPAWQNTLDVREFDVGYTIGATVELRTRGTLVVAPRVAFTRGLQRLGLGPQNVELDARNSNTVIGLTVTIPIR
jgi:hypothetical protein